MGCYIAVYSVLYLFELTCSWFALFPVLARIALKMRFLVSLGPFLAKEENNK